MEGHKFNWIVLLNKKLFTNAPFLHLHLQYDCGPMWTHINLCCTHWWSWWLRHFDHRQILWAKGVWQQLPHCHLLAHTIGLRQVHVPV